MKKLIKRACCFLFVLVVLCASFPFSAFAVDPVSAGVMANAFAQAIAAYGASNGVAMTFDVTSTNGIGESVHELWKDFRDGTQDADDYATLAAALFPDLYYKASVAVGTAADIYTVGYNITSEYAEEFDKFYNWLLSGPAEMVQVDNQYYQFSQAQIGASSSPIVVFSNEIGNVPFAVGTTNNSTYNGTSVMTYGVHAWSYNNYDHYVATIINDVPAYGFFVQTESSGSYQLIVASPSSSMQFNTAYGARNASWPGTYSDDSTTHLHYGAKTSINGASTFTGAYPLYSTIREGLDAVAALISSGSTTESVGVKAYDNTGVAEFPDTADPNYDATHRAKQIPSSVPWDDALYGDGTGTLTDAESEAIADAADGVIAEDGALTLAGEDEATDEPGTDDPPSTDPDDYVVLGLEDVFPFCIPFDIYNFLEALAASPVAPHFTVTLAFPEAVGGTQTIDLDFDSPTWNQLAQLLRLLELLAFIVGLALLTRSMFLRG